MTLVYILRVQNILKNKMKESYEFTVVKITKIFSEYFIGCLKSYKMCIIPINIFYKYY